MERMRSSAILGFLLMSAAPPMIAQDVLPEGTGKAALLKDCHGCHPPESIAAKRYDREGWEKIITKMIDAGATGTDDEFNLIADYLTEHFPKQVNVNKASAAVLAQVLGIASKDADAVVAYRQKNGDFKTMEDLKKVPGIDAAKLDPKKIQF